MATRKTDTRSGLNITGEETVRAKKTVSKKAKQKSTAKKKITGGKSAVRKKPRQKNAAQEASPPFTKPIIVGIGASAGGLEALELLLRNMPVDTGMVFVIITHQHPGHTSLMPELLGKYTQMPIVQVNTATEVTQDHVYLASPGQDLSLLNSVLQPIEAHRSLAKGVNSPIDYFFRSLAQDKGHRAAGIVLSGTGTDGTVGLRAIKGETGLTMVQEVHEARFDGMPMSAIATGLVDYVLPAREMPKRLVSYFNGLDGELPALETSKAYNQILELLRERTGHNFSGYKNNTIARRVERRMNLHQIDDLTHYAHFLHDSRHEVELLFRELLIGVTSFFRNPDAFEALERAFIPRLEELPADQTVRIWVPGCSTGEEAYSIAMLLRECMDRLEKRLPVQIFATDLDFRATDAARTGTYANGIAIDVGKERLERFFIKKDDVYQISRAVREMVVFAPQNVFEDPPFTRLDLVSCRNLLIYLEGQLQRRLLSLFHYVLRPGGLLFLGPSETMGSFGDLFDTVDKKWKVFRRSGTSTALQRYQIEFPPTKHRPEKINTRQPVRFTNAPAWPTIVKEATAALIAHCVPPSVIVTPQGRVVYIHQRTGEYLEPPPGDSDWNIQNMARKGLGPLLTAAMRKAASQKKDIFQQGIEVQSNGSSVRLDLVVRPITSPESLVGMLLISFTPSQTPLPKRRRMKDSAADEQVGVIEQELQYTRKSLQGMIEELETTNEELQTTNEELQATNEELQSTNEELETSREEMQSLNDELQAVNAELEQKVEELSRANDDMANLLNSTNIATLFLDGELRVKRFTPQAEQLIHLIDTDVGRPVSDIASELVYETLTADGREVLRTLVPKEAELRARDGSRFRMRIMPYRTTENVIDGLVITFIDVTELKEAQQGAEAAKAFAEGVVERVREPLMILDEHLRVVTVNRSFSESFGLSVAKARGQSLGELELDWGGGLTDELARLSEKQPVIQGRMVQLKLPRVGRRSFTLTTHLMCGEDGPDMTLLMFEDITRYSLLSVLESLPVTITGQDLQLCYRWIHNPPFGMDEAAFLDRTDDEVFAGQAGAIVALKQRVLASGQRMRETVILSLAGQSRRIRLDARPQVDPAGEVNGVICTIIDTAELEGP